MRLYTLYVSRASRNRKAHGPHVCILILLVHDANINFDHLIHVYSYHLHDLLGLPHYMDHQLIGVDYLLFDYKKKENNLKKKLKYSFCYDNITFVAGVAEWQTHQTQNLTVATSCGFKSHLLHNERQHGICRAFSRYMETDQPKTCSTSRFLLMKGEL